MRRYQKILGACIGVVIVLPASFMGWAYWRVSNPNQGTRLELPKNLISIENQSGQEILDASFMADHPALSQTFQSQEKGSWCGVASAVTVLNARGAQLTQDSFFTDKVTDIRPWFRTTFGGMPIGDLAKMLTAHGAQPTVKYAGNATVDVFRKSLESNANNPKDWLIVNYDRKVIGQAGGGHISPISAYSKAEDKVLLLDTAGYKYPFHWIPVDILFQAMNTSDSESKQSRGWVVVR